MTLHAYLFGGFNLAWDETPLPILPGTTTRALLAYLLVHKQPHTRDRLSGLYWPDFSDAATLGCLLALVREENDDPRLHCRLRANKFRVFSGVTPVGRWLDSEAESLYEALMACEHH